LFGLIGLLSGVGQAFARGRLIFRSLR
jgi:hypothetical protein